MNHHSKVAAWQELNRRVADDLKAGTGDIKPAVVLERKANPAKVHIGWFRRRILRGEFRKRR